MLFCGFSRESCDQGCTQTDIRNLTSQLFHYIDQFLLRSPSAHPLQNRIIRMLDRKIKIMADFRFFLHHLDQFICNLFRITV